MIEYNKKMARMWSIMGINPAIWSIGFNEIISNKEKVALFTADLARYSGLMRTFKKYPEKCFNLGIAEQNMVTIASGMAMEGVQCFMTTYAPFMALRCTDQVRHLMGNLNLDMKAIGSAAGLSAGLSGPSLLAINDISLMRSIPNMIVLQPADCMEAVKMIIAMSEIKSPVYMRFCGTVNLPMVYTDDYDFQIGKIVELKKGSRIALLASGTNVVADAVEAGKVILEQTGLQVTVANVHTIKPLDKDYIKNLTNNHDVIFTIEEHSIIGGLGGAVAEYLATFDNKTRVQYIGIEDCNGTMGSRAFMMKEAGLTVENIVNKAIEVMENI